MKKFLFFTLLLLFPGCALAQIDQPLVTNFDRDFLFVYSDWNRETAKVAGGALNLSAKSGRGGLGDNFSTDFSGYGDLSPVLKLSVGPNNHAKMLRLMLRDAKEGASTWNFSLEKVAPGQVVTIAPVWGASLSMPSSKDKGGATLSQIAQWQVQGDWSGDALDVSLDEIRLSTPTPEIEAVRTAYVQKLAEDAEKLRLEREELQKKYVRSTKSPTFENVEPVASNVVALEIQSGRVVPSSLSTYVAQDGDKIEEHKRSDGLIETEILKRDGRDFGWLIGPKRETLVTMESLEGDPLLDFVADDKENYAVSSPDDPNFARPVKPLSVRRKSKPDDWAQGPGDQAVRHILYLTLPQNLTTGKRYTVRVGLLNTRESSVSFVADAHARSEAVHVNQIGYRGDDPAKTAFVSCWMGTGGALKLPDTLRFSIVNDKTGKTVFSGTTSDIWRADKPEKMAREANFSGTDVAKLDFSSLQTPGRYRVAVEGIGSSFPFEIGPDVWKRAFIVQMRGLFHQRSGMELGPPFTAFKKPRDMNPADGFVVTKTKYRSVESGGEAWDAIRAGDTGEAVPQAWGGYHDAGDWNPRRATHMKATMASLEVFEMFPAYFSKVETRIPKTPGVPDVLGEAMWEVDCFRRLQQKDGGIPYGIESGLGDPLPGEVSWINSFPSYVFTADYANSWFYAGVSARLARLLESFDSKKADQYRQSALRAFDFAETDFARDKAAGWIEKRPDTWQALDGRNLAALEIYLLTRDAKWHAIFLENSVLKDEKPELFQWGKSVQREAAFAYACLPQGLGDENLKKKAVAATEAMAQKSLAYAAQNAWDLTTPDAGKPQFLGFYTTPDAADLTRAHFLTQKPEYLAGAVRATQFQSGANPSNLVYTTGLGANPVKGTFKLDARRTGQAVPEGLTPYGNIDLVKWGEQGWINWPITWFVGKVTVPSAYDWPTNEAYWDVGAWPSLNEFTVDIWAPNLQVWGYLAARGAKS